MTYTTNIDKFYCCLNTAEQTAFVLCAANAGPVTYFVLKTLFDAVWLLAIEGSSSIRSQTFVANWGLTLGSFPPDDPDAIEVYFLESSIWDDVNAYFDAEGTSCDGPCRVRTFPE